MAVSTVEIPRRLEPFLRTWAKRNKLTVEQTAVALLFSNMLDMEGEVGGINEKAKELALAS